VEAPDFSPATKGDKDQPGFSPRQHKTGAKSPIEGERHFAGLKPGASTLQFPPAFHRLLHGDLVGVFDVAADGNAGGDARHLYRR
jgi:hypothetical protein